jgi:hypothetical protein
METGAARKNKTLEPRLESDRAANKVKKLVVGEKHKNGKNIQQRAMHV